MRPSPELERSFLPHPQVRNRRVNRQFRPARPPGPLPSYPGPDDSGLPKNAMETQYVVVHPPPRYEIVGLLQQCSYAAVNEHRRIRRPICSRIPCSEGVREGLQIIAGREHSRGPGTRPPPLPADLTTVPLWPSAPPSASPSTPAPLASGPWSSTSRPG